MLPNLSEDKIQQLSLDKEAYFREMVADELVPVKGRSFNCATPLIFLEERKSL